MARLVRLCISKKENYQATEIQRANLVFSSDFYYLSRICVTSLIIDDPNLHRNGKKENLSKLQLPSNNEQSDGFYSINAMISRIH